MNPKRWFAWVCLALMLVAEILLFRANHEKDAALTSLREAQHEEQQLTASLDELKNSNAGLQAAEISGLRKQNAVLTNKLAIVQASNDLLVADIQNNAQHLTTARTALQLQQEHLAQLQTENEQIAVAHALTVQKTTCINNLREIDAAKQQWALEKNKTTTAVPTVANLLPYLTGGVMPVCPAGGAYTINAVDEMPSCSITGHDLPPP